MVRVSEKNFLNEGFEYGFLSHATVAEFLEPFLRVGLIHMPGKKGGGDYGVKQVLSICLVETTR